MNPDRIGEQIRHAGEQIKNVVIPVASAFALSLLTVSVGGAVDVLDNLAAAARETDYKETGGIDLVGLPSGYVVTRRISGRLVPEETLLNNAWDRINVEGTGNCARIKTRILPTPSIGGRSWQVNIKCE